MMRPLLQSYIFGVEPLWPNWPMACHTAHNQFL